MRSSTGGVGAWIRYGNPLEPGELDFAIAHYRAAILQPWETEAAARLKEARPDMTVLAYRCLSSTRDFEPDSMRASGLSYREALRRGWLARRDNGDLVEWNTYPGHFQARVWDPDYRARWVEEVCQATAETAFDGVMADNDVFDDYYGLDLPLDGIADTAALRAELNIFVDQAGAGLNGVGKILIPNVAEARREPGRWERHSAWAGGTITSSMRPRPWPRFTSCEGRACPSCARPTAGAAAPCPVPARPPASTGWRPSGSSGEGRAPTRPPVTTTTRALPGSPPSTPTWGARWDGPGGPRAPGCASSRAEWPPSRSARREAAPCVSRRASGHRGPPGTRTVRRWLWRCPSVRIVG